MDADLGLGDIFTRSPSPPPPEPTFAHYTRFRCFGAVDNVSDRERLSIRLVGSHPLWGHYLWNAARCFASFLDRHEELCKGMRVLELGAGGGLPSIIAALCGARSVVITDYPDQQLIENIRINVEHNIPMELRDGVQVQGHIWGRSVAELISNGNHREKFDLILMSDLIFNHSQHDALLQTAESCLAEASAFADADLSLRTQLKPPCVLAFYTHHRPHLAERDMGFFSKANERGWTCEEIVTERFQPMFPDDSGDETVRSIVHGWRLTRS